MAGYVAGCTIEGGTINIGEGAFVVDQYGNVTMGGNSKFGDVTIEELDKYINDLNNTIYSECPIHGQYLSDQIWVVGENDYVQTDENGNIVDSSGNVIAPTIAYNVSEDRTTIIDSEGNIIGAIQENLVVDANGDIIGVYNEARNAMYSIIGYMQDGAAVDKNGTSIGDVDGKVVTKSGALVGLTDGAYVVQASIVGTTTVSIVEPGSILRSINDGNGLYRSEDWISAVSKYDEQYSSLLSQINGIEGNLDQHFEFSSDNGLVLKDTNSDVYARLRNNKFAFIQHDSDPLVGDTEVAYISDKKLYISNAEITGENGDDGSLDVDGTATVKELRVNNTDTSNTLVIQSESNGSFSILIQM